MIDDVERYRFITSKMRYFADRMQDSFKLYIQLATAIIGGFIWLCLQPGASQQSGSTLLLVPPLFLILGVFMLCLIWFDYRAWYGYRKAESKLIGDMHPPGFPRSVLAEIFMTFAMLSLSIVAYFYLRGWLAACAELREIIPRSPANTTRSLASGKWCASLAQAADRAVARWEAGARRWIK